ncbi:MAG TPA: DNA recombination protein RmuC, partial [Candidatus Saccharimonadales bacterium]
VILAVVVAGFTLVIFYLNQRLKELKNAGAVEMLKADMTELTRSIGTLQQAMGDKLERNSTNMQMSVQKQLSESAKLIADVTQRLTTLDETNKRVVTVADELKTLQNVLQNPKQRGVFGEYYLQSVLENVLPPGQFQMQYKFADGEIVDAAIFLEKGRVLPVDSKFSLENYNRMIEANEKTERDRLLQKIKVDLKGRIDETSKYIRPSENTMDFAFMFIPSESLYYDLLINNVGSAGSSRDLIEYAFRDRRVIIVSPTSFMAYLQTVLQGLRSLQIEEQAKDIQIRVGKLGQHIGKFETYMQKLGVSLGTTVGHYNNAHKELAKVDKDIVKIASTDPSVEPQLLDRPQDDE